MKFVKKFKQDEKARKQRDIDLQFMPSSMKKRNSLSNVGLDESLTKKKNNSKNKNKKTTKRKKKKKKTKGG